ncbi:TetR/AcrR family transcriptional regulator [Streptomyces pseudogriseolus]|uniref:TetR/AcrR family transcriptional regulator n=1 Tax=Streptomyces pseudogriseolus TaxID=36817 RepID=UPI003FA25008
MTNDNPVPEPARRIRPDVQRNLDALLAAATELFAEQGVDAPVRQITARAGVGAGTFYRHFPQRSDLITAVFRHEVDACAEAAPALAEQHAPMEALTLWLRRFTEFVAAKRGLKAALHSGDPAYANLPGYFQQQFVPVLTDLMNAAAAAGDIEPGFDPFDLLHAMSDLVDPENPDYTERIIALIISGLRYREG